MKRLLIIVGIIAVVALAANFLISSIAGAAISKAVETFAPKITGTTVTLKSAGVSPLTGGGSMNGLVIGNPKGFSDPSIIELGHASMSISPMSLINQPIHIKSIVVKEAKITYERKLTSSNLDVLLSNIKKNLGADDKAAKEEPTGKSEMRFIVDEIIIEGATIRASTMGVGATLPMPPLTLRDLGRDSGGMTTGDLIAEVVGAISRQSLGAIASGGKALFSGGKDATKGVGDAAEKAADKVKGLFGN